MQNYKTVYEKATEWNITPRHIQYLCRTGKIEGALKRAGSWFIPEDTTNPAKNTKSGTEGFQFVGTKRKIFDSAIELFMSKGYNNVSLRDIAKSVGIRQSTIYNHFHSKQEILDTIYDFYCQYFLRDRPSLEEMERIVQERSPSDIIRSIRYDFKTEYVQKMSDITKILFQRIPVDKRAKEISKSLVVEDGINYVEVVFNRAIVAGRFAPFDTHTMAVFINRVRIFTLYSWVVDPSPDNMAKLSEDEQALYQYATKFLTDFKPPATNNQEI